MAQIGAKFGRQTFNIAPSDLTFLLDDCLKCFYLKVVHGVRRLAGPMPGVFTVMDRQQRRYFDGRPSTDICQTLAPGVLRCEGDMSIRSAPVPIRKSVVA